MHFREEQLLNLSKIEFYSHGDGNITILGEWRLLDAVSKYFGLIQIIFHRYEYDQYYESTTRRDQADIPFSAVLYSNEQPIHCLLDTSSIEYRSI